MSLRIARQGLIFTLFLSPLLFGTVEVWSIALMELSIFVIFLLWLKGNSSADSKGIRLIETPLFIPMLLILILGVFHLIPLPQPVIKVISPGTYEVYNNKLLGDSCLFTLSLFPYGTLLEMMRLLTYIMAFFLTIQLFSKERQLLRLVKAMMVIGTVVALIGLFQMIFNNEKILWIRKLRQGGTPFGPYVNRNHFAGLMEMLIPLSTGMLIRFSPSLSLKKGLRYGLSEFMRHERANIFILSLTAVVIMITALFVSLSRGGIIGLSISMLLFGAMLILRNSTKKKGIIIVLISAITLLTVGWFGWDMVIERFEKLKQSDLSSEMRLHNWRDSVRIVKDFPFTGTGPGTYEKVYPRYKTIPSQERWEHAHNDYIEGTIEMGIIGLIIVLYAIFKFYRIMFTGLMKRRLLDARILSIGAMTGVTGILIHSITDFNLHIGANGLYFFVLLAISIIAINIKPTEEKGTLLSERIIPKYLRSPVYGLSIVMTLVVSLIVISGLYSASISGPVRDGRENLLKKKGMLDIAMRLNPVDPEIPFARGNISSVLGLDDDALKDYRRAVRLNPLSGEYLQMLCLTLDRKGLKDTVDDCFVLSIRYDPTSAWLRKNYGLWLLSKGRKAEAMTEIKKAIELDPSNTRLYLTGLILSGFSPDQIRDVIPENTLAQLQYGRFREERGELDEALDAYTDALSLMKRDLERNGTVMPEVYLRIGGIYEKKDMLKEALSIYEEGVNLKPDDYSLRVSLARTYDRLGIAYRAMDEYRKALVLNPSSRFAQQRLKRLGNDMR